MTTAEITAGSTMRELLEAYPGAQRALMREYHIGGCSSCGFAPDDRLGDVLANHNVLNVDEVIEYIKIAQVQEERIQISPKELAQMRAEKAPLRLIDVREPEEQAIAMIDDALPATQTLMQEMLDSWPKETPIVTCCHHGMRSLDAASYLIGHGFTNVRSLTGGLDAWAEEIDSSMTRY